MRQENKRCPLISVIVPVYNGEKYIQESINSIIQQSLYNIEIILIDDGSDDASYQICKGISEKDERIIVLQIKHSGVATARNKGMKKARGKYLLFMDADDWMDRDMLQYLYCLAENAEADIAVCGFIKEYRNKKNVRRDNKNTDILLRGKEVIDEINYNGDFSPFLFNKLFRRETIATTTFREGVAIGEDYGFIIEVLLKNPIVVCGSESKYHYRQHSDSVSYCGFFNRQITKNNRSNYEYIYRLLCQSDSNLKEGALAYYILQEMAVVISMVKSGIYDNEIIKEIQKKVREYLKEYLLIKRVPRYLKICAVLLSINDRLLIVPYRKIFHRIRSAD